MHVRDGHFTVKIPVVDHDEPYAVTVRRATIAVRIEADCDVAAEIAMGTISARLRSDPLIWILDSEEVIRGQ